MSANLLPYITAGLRFPADDILCKGDTWQRGCASADGEAAYAIHTYKGKHMCAYHSPFDNKYAPCTECGIKPALMAGEDEQICDDCLGAAERVSEYDYYLAMTGAHDLRHPDRPAPGDLPASPDVDHYTKEAFRPAAHVCDEDAERALYGRYVSDGLADTDGYFAPESFEAWRAHYHRGIGYQEPRTAACTDTECHAPRHERTRLLDHGRRRQPGQPRFEELCPSCHAPREAALFAAQQARRDGQRRPAEAPEQGAIAA
ncbi:hypothetical protein AQJ30_15640 [Streptomyces longwoodensis]|uniref:Uncharacterized protein n=1 Tax=Streptomyces longwoodensis TaxID=68231 RepID=A0A101QX93_9ACTN|nr:hypothetical protein [Streptomyces longwoodensis]KUN37715.1 hypothetical protein AQJ30_15640 [Streptomyces longwoodensis]